MGPPKSNILPDYRQILKSEYPAEMHPSRDFLTKLSGLVDSYMIHPLFKFRRGDQADPEMLHYIPDKKHVLVPIGRTSGQFPPDFFDLSEHHAPHLYSRCHPDPFRFGGLIITKNTPPQSLNPKSECNIAFSSL